MTEYGGIDAMLRDDGLHIDRAAQRVGFSTAILEMANPDYLRRSENGDVIVTGRWTATGESAELIYRPVGTDQDGRIIVCERIRNLTEETT